MPPEKRLKIYAKALGTATNPQLFLALLPVPRWARILTAPMSWHVLCLALPMPGKCEVLRFRTVSTTLVLSLQVLRILFLAPHQISRPVGNGACSTAELSRKMLAGCLGRRRFCSSAVRNVYCEEDRDQCWVKSPGSC